MIAVTLRTLLVYFFLIAEMRIMGKRQLGQLQISELITAFLLSELAALPITDLGIPIAYSLLPITLIISLEVAISTLANRFPMLKKVVDGVPSIIINKGVINEKELKKLRLGVDELLCEIRLKNVPDISDVQYAILEENGQLSVFPKKDFSPVTLGDLKIRSKDEGIPHALIIDGKISSYNMKLTNTKKSDLKKMLGERKVRDVLLLCIDDMGKVSTVMKENKKGGPTAL